MNEKPLNGFSGDNRKFRFSQTRSRDDEILQFSLIDRLIGFIVQVTEFEQKPERKFCTTEQAKGMKL